MSWGWRRRPRSIAIVKGWAHRGKPIDSPDFMTNVREANPGAEFVYTAPPRVSGHFPVVYAWHPMHGNGHRIARRNDAAGSTPSWPRPTPCTSRKTPSW